MAGEVLAAEPCKKVEAAHTSANYTMVVEVVHTSVNYTMVVGEHYREMLQS